MYRTEKDIMGSIEVPADAYYGAFTQRAKINFQISGIRAHKEFLVALATIKKAAALSDIELKQLDEKIGDAIVKAAVTEMVEAILKDKKRILPCAAYCNSEYNVNGYFVGVPVKLGRKWVEKVIELKLTDEEKESFKKSVEHVKGLVQATEKFL